MEEKFHDENIVVALGDTTYIFRLPDLMTFTQDFLSDTEIIPREIALKFIASQQTTARIPIFKYLQELNLEETSLNPTEKQKIKDRIERHGKIEDSTDKISNSYKKRFPSLQKIRNNKYRTKKEIEVISYNINSLNLDAVEQYIKQEFQKIESANNTNLNSAFRRLPVVYDIKRYKS